MEYRVEGPQKRLFDARVDVIGSSVILHSRGGATGGRPPRNQGYAEALQVICRRAANGGYLERVLIDSSLARRRPEAERVLVSRPEIDTLDGDALAKAIRVRMRRFGQVEGVRGGNSTKQVRLEFSLRHSSIIQSLVLRKVTGAGESAYHDDAGVKRLSFDEQRRVTTLQVRQAVDRLLAGEDAPHFSASRDYDLITADGERLAPKKVFGLALEAALGIEAFPGHFIAGWGEPCFDLLQEAGYTIVEKQPEGSTPAAGHPTDDIPLDPDERSWAEGSTKVARHLRTERRRDPRASAEKRNFVRAANGGRLVCENTGCNTDWYAIFPVAVAESVFEIHHSTPVATMAESHQTVLADLVCLCASCHRAEHRRLALEAGGTATAAAALRHPPAPPGGC